MATNYISSEIVKNGKKLIFFATSLHSNYVSKQIEAVVAEAFEKLSPYMQEKSQVLYIRDIPELCVDRNYPFNECYNPREAMIAVDTWTTGSLNMKHLSLAVHQTLFQMARLQNVGSSHTFGDEVFNRGVAAYYAHVMTGWVPPCGEVKVTKQMRRMALRRWDIKYRYYSRWFGEGRRSKWRGYAIGYELARVSYRFNDSANPDIEHAIKAYGSWYGDKLWALNHGRSTRGLLCTIGSARRPLWSYFA